MKRNFTFSPEQSAARFFREVDAGLQKRAGEFAVKTDDSARVADFTFDPRQAARSGCNANVRESRRGGPDTGQRSVDMEKRMAAPGVTIGP